MNQRNIFTYTENLPFLVSGLCSHFDVVDTIKLILNSLLQGQDYAKIKGKK